MIPLESISSPSLARTSPHRRALLRVLLAFPIFHFPFSILSAAEVLPRPLDAIAATLEPTRTVIYKTVAGNELRLHIFEPAGHQPTDKRAALVSIHGGGWTGGNARVTYPFAHHFSELGMVGISIEYRLLKKPVGTTVFDCVKDGRSAVRYVRKHAAELGVDPDRIVVSGHSAGGHVAAGTALVDEINEASDDLAVSPVPDVLILYYPVIDTSAEGYGQEKIGERWEELSPLHRVRAGLPPTLVLHGTGDTVTPFEGARHFHEKMLAAGNECQLITHEGGRHGYFIFDLDLYAEAMKQTEAFLVECGMLSAPVATAEDDDTPLFSIELTVARQGIDQETCWVHARAGAIPPWTAANAHAKPLVVMTLQQLQLAGTDVFHALNEMQTADLGATWSAPRELASFARAPFQYGDRQDLEITVCDFTPKWHAKTGTLLGTGHTVVYEDNRLLKVRPRATAYAVYDPAARSWSPWETIAMPDEPRFRNAGAGCVQRCDLPNGDILLPVYFKEPSETRYSVAVMRCSFDGKTLRYLEHGNELSVPEDRGLYEPSLTRFGDRFFLTLRNDDHGYVSVSEDGMNYAIPKRWTFDDGSDLGNYNTQQHWVTHSDALFLVYTRRGADNDHIMRHRAPLFIAQVDPERLQVIRETERVIVPEKGARLGNFGVTDVSETETWITAAEWMQGLGPNHADLTPLTARGADNRIWVAKIRWKSPSESPN